jgi:transcription elongation factor Elf1
LFNPTLASWVFLLQKVCANKSKLKSFQCTLICSNQFFGIENDVEPGLSMSNLYNDVQDMTYKVNALENSSAQRRP